MRWIVVLVFVASLVACKKDEKAEPRAGGGTDAAKTATPPPPDAEPAPPPPPPAAAKPTAAAAIAELKVLLTKIEGELGVAMMHGCAEGRDRLEGLFEEAEESSERLATWLRDEALRAEVSGIVEQGSDRDLAILMGKILAAASACQGGEPLAPMPVS